MSTADQEGELPPLPSVDETITKRGMIWTLGSHRLICGDSRDWNTIVELCTEATELLRPDMTFCDPPYGVALGAKNRMLDSFDRAGRRLEDIQDDDLTPEQLRESLKLAMSNVRRIMADHASVYVTAPQGGGLGLMMLQMMEDAGLPVRHVLMWMKNQPTFSMGRLDYDYKHEPIFYTWGKRHLYYGKGSQRTSVWQFDRPRSSVLHSTMKPVPLVANALLNSSKEGDIVLDIYGGSGTTLMAAEQLKRRCFMSEIDPRYCDCIVRRWENFTRKKAELCKVPSER